MAKRADNEFLNLAKKVFMLNSEERQRFEELSDKYCEEYKIKRKA